MIDDPKNPPVGGGSPNEPPGSNIGETAPPSSKAQSETAKEFKRELLPSDSELHKMTRAELDELAEQRGVDISSASNKDDVIELLRKDARKRR
jgi:hypothetical protein